MVSRRALSYSLVSISGLLLIGVLVINFTRDPLLGDKGSADLLVTFVSVIVLIAVLLGLGMMVVRRFPNNPIGWLFLVLGLVMSFGVTAEQYVKSTFQGEPLPGILLMGWVYTWTFQSPAFFGLFIFVFLLFPTGRPPTPRWSWVARIGGVATAALALFSAFGTKTVPDLPLRNPFSIGLMVEVRQAVELVAFPLLLVSLVLAVASLIVRFRKAHGVEKQQIKWLMASGSLLVTSFVLAPLIIWPNPSLEWLWLVMFLVSVTSIPIAAGIAILKYRLYDIDVVINKTVVYGALAAFITAVYVGMVVGVGSLVGVGGEPNLGLSLAATALVAVAFQPVRERVQGVANRLVYGQRISPYEAVTSFSHRMAESLSFSEVLPSIAEAAASAVGGERSKVTLVFPQGGSEEIVWPSGTDPTHYSFDATVSVTHQGEVVGEISVAKKKGEALTASEQKLLSDLASQAGLAFSNLRLTEELKAKLVELQESRRRIVSAQDEERRRMERDIHDGAQQQLVSMSVKLGLTKALIAKDTERAQQMLDQLKAEASETVETLRDLARGLFPQVLSEQGLIPALQSHIDKMGISATVEADSFQRLNSETEAALYFVVREALQNASKYAPNAPITVSFSYVDRELAFQVTDQGPGFESARGGRGSGIQNMRDRIEALGGKLWIDSQLGTGTKVIGSVPASMLESVS